MIAPSTRIALALRAALRRRYGYAALRVVRVAVRKAIADHLRRSLDASRAYNADGEELRMRSLYSAAVRRLLSSWPDLSLSDERAAP